MIVKGTNTQKILSDYFDYYTSGTKSSFDSIPNEIYINGVLQNYTGKNIKYLKGEINIIKLVWNFTITNCNVMFKDLNNIIYIDFSKFDASKVTNMIGMFDSCKQLVSVNFKNFNTSSVKNMNGMFKDCNSLISLDLNSFDTSSVTDMSKMFYYCKELVTININNFVFKSVTNLYYIFSHCENLLYLDLSNANATKVTKVDGMFSFCPKLIFINFYDFIFPSSVTFQNMFDHCKATLCINKEYGNLKTALENNINNCSYSCFQNSQKLLEQQKECINNCSTTDNYKYEYNNICYSSCPNGTYQSSKNEYLCEDKISEEQSENINTTPNENDNKGTENYSEDINICDIKCKNCSKESSDMNLCISCNIENNYYPKLNDSSNNLSFINCYNISPDAYFLDKENNIYKPCYYKCQTCNEEGNDYDNKCITCKPNYNFKNFFINDTNCYEECLYYYFFDSNGKYQCTLNYTCPKEYSKIIKEKKMCINDCSKDNIYKYEENNICYNKSTIKNNSLIETEGTEVTQVVVECSDDFPYIKNNVCLKECNSLDIFNNICTINSKYDKIYDELIDRIKKDLSNGVFDSLLFNLTNEDKKELIFNKSNIIFQITTSDNKANNLYENISTLLLGDCENILKRNYNINQSLLIFKIDYFQQGSLIPIVNYEVYHPINKTKLDLNYCNDKLINLSIPVNIDENNYYKYDPNNDYYNDLCNSYTNEYGTDILLNDRHDEYNDNNMSICENNCKIKDYSSNGQNVICECEIKYTLTQISEMMNNDINSLNYNFDSKNLSSNMISMKCYYKLFTKDGIYKNIANYILLFFITFFLISAILFYKCGYPLLEDDIQKIVQSDNFITKNYNNNETIDINFKNKSINKIIKRKKKKKKSKRYKKINKKEIDSKVNIKKNNNKNKNKKRSNDKSNSNIKFQQKGKKGHIIPKQNKNKNKNILRIKYDDYKINSCLYKNALKYDKRTICSYYFSLIRTKHPLIFSFCPIKDYNSKIIKIDLFLLSFSFYYFTNALFFNESLIHKIYEKKGIYNLIYLIPFILYSFIISHILSMIIKYIFLSERNICEINFVDNKEKSNKAYNVKKGLVLKYIIFFVSGSLFLFFLWYYLSSFGAVYQNTQVYLIKNTLISFSFSLIYPFIVYIFVAFIRIYSLKDSDRTCLYKFSEIIQYI